MVGGGFGASRVLGGGTVAGGGGGIAERGFFFCFLWPLLFFFFSFPSVPPFLSRPVVSSVNVDS